MSSEEDLPKGAKLFTIDRNREVRVSEFENDSIQTSIVYEMNLGLQTITSQTYSFPDFLADIGGLACCLSAIFGAVVMILSYNSAYHYITQATYEVEE